MNLASRHLGKLHQWGKEKMGGEAKGGPTDEFKALEQEMNLRHEGLEKLHSSMTGYVKNLTKKSEGDGKERSTPVGHLGTTMSRHGEMFEEGNRFGECLAGFGAANERISRFQESYATSATGCWLEALERSLAQMKDYQNARRKLESRRSAYESTLAKIQKARKEDYKTEDELRAQRAKYDESTEEVYRRMQDIVDAEQESSQDLYAFVEAELHYHDRCREVLLQLKRAWPVPSDTTNSNTSRHPRSRTNTLSKVPTTDTIGEDSLVPPPTLPFRGGARSLSGSSSPLPSPHRELSGYDLPARPTLGSRTATTEAVPGRIGSARAPSAVVDAASLRAATPLRPMRRRTASQPADVIGDTHDDDHLYHSSPHAAATPRSVSPATSASHSSAIISRNTSYSNFENTPGVGPLSQSLGTKKAAPPPPPSRATKPPPPPPPMKRSALSSSSVPHA